MLLGYRVSQKSVLWPLVAVMLPGWLLLVALVHNPVTDGHAQMALRARVARQMFAHEHASTLAGSPPGRAAIDSLYRQVREAGMIQDRQLVDEALVFARLGDSTLAAKLLAEVIDPAKAGPYLALVEKAVQDQPLDKAELEKLDKLLASAPGDWWLQTLRKPQDAASTAALAAQRQWAWWEVRCAEWWLPVLAVLALLLAIPAWNVLRGPWTIWPYSERVQRLWPVALMLCVLSLRGLFLLLGNHVANLLVPLFAWAGPRDPAVVYQIEVCLGFVCGFLLLIATTYGVRECVASRWGTLGDVLGFERREFLERRLWYLAFPCAIALLYGLEPLHGLLDHWHLGGRGLYDRLSRSPGGYLGLGSFFSLVHLLAFAPFFEEVIYRGFLLSALRTWAGPFWGVLLSSLLFALAHGAGLEGDLNAFIQGAAFACLKQHTGRLSTAIAMHVCVNAVWAILCLLQGA